MQRRHQEAADIELLLGKLLKMLMVSGVPCRVPTNAMKSLQNDLGCKV